MRWFTLAVILVSQPLWAAPSNSTFDFGADASVTASSHLIFSNEEVDDENSSSIFMHEAQVRGNYTNYTLGVNFNTQMTLDEEYQDLNKPFYLEKKTAQAKWGSFEAIIGDSYVQLGRGIALSLYKDATFGLDSTLEGAAVRFKPAGFDGRIFAGRVNPLDYPVAVNPAPNPLGTDTLWMAGGSVKGRLINNIQIGGHYLLTLNQPLDSDEYDKRTHTVGATFSKSGLSDGIDLYLESNAMLAKRLGTLEEDFPTAFGSFAALIWSPVPWQVKIEGKDYRDFRFAMQRPPTLEDDVVESINTHDVSATRLSVERQFLQARSSVRASYLLGDDRSKESIIHHGVTGTKFPIFDGADLDLSAGYRTLPQKASLLHAQAKSKLKTAKGQYLELTYRKQFNRDNLDFLVTETDRNVVELAYTFSRNLNVSVGYEYVPTNLETESQHFANLGTTLVIGAFTGKAFVGQTSGGTVCSGGVCRRVPPYTGAMLESTYTF